MTDLQGKVALVTGAGSGIGEACAKALAAAGAAVVVSDLSGESAARVAADIGPSAAAIAANVTDEQQCQAMVALAIERFGRLDIAVNNAGVGNDDKSLVGDLPFGEWRRVLGVNLDGVFLSMQAEIRAMRIGGSGSIINISSVMGQVSVQCASAYVAAKHGVVGLTRAAALDHAPEGIRINAVGPGYVDTPLLTGRTAEEMAALDALHALGRIARPEEVAALVLWLASPAASFATGAYYPIDGGYLAR